MVAEKQRKPVDQAVWAFWPKVVLKKWLNLRSKDSNSNTNSEDDLDGDVKIPGESDEESRPAAPFRLLRRQNSATMRAEYIDTRELRVFVGTFNAAGIPPSPSSGPDIAEWMDIDLAGGDGEQADVYVLGFQEVVPLNAGVVSGAEDLGPGMAWEELIRDTLRRAGSRPRCRSHPATPARSFHGDDTDTSDRVSLAWPEPPLHLLAKLTTADLGNYNEKKEKKDCEPFVRMVSKQMVGIFLTVWVRRELRKFVHNIKVSTVGVGATGKAGNKGAVSASMSIHQTTFCFVCTHLAAGERPADLLKRNTDVHEIHRRTRFSAASNAAGLELPREIHDHERIFWLGDLNYRIEVPYDRAHGLVAAMDWAGLAEKDQLKRELRKGRAFEGWAEGALEFAPTYKYEIGPPAQKSRYIGDDGKGGRRTPAWCDRVLSYGKGLRLLRYTRVEMATSDHRPVAATYGAEVEVFCGRKLQRVLALTTAKVERGEAAAVVPRPPPDLEF
ncbi:type I inositol polyphosphate 5-phosphatase 1 [Brachypodium distachyon]|uniref:Inositol polyphosphate-related phosphatase domain-containing protein n=1 Tax=Brachypodium distachyon TaxID=15368 RepID=I1HCQ5_BRADI|nr:type I inositol polyphosphate 5-phosphatase 1 [Brachypodium distachyon]KQK03056.1 hypothetical protein BRADI_2g05260v3 [Brachypodium distachyon]|eukprot:XP_003565436.1 type I inositol polyphosphate 5-phosphatase 1 [Brachypodium distachyon]